MSSFDIDFADNSVPSYLPAKGVIVDSGYEVSDLSKQISNETGLGLNTQPLSSAFGLNASPYVLGLDNNLGLTR